MISSKTTWSLLLIFTSLTLFVGESRGGWSFLRDQSKCGIVCENGGVCAFNTENPRIHKCICFIGIFWGDRCQYAVQQSEGKESGGPENILHDSTESGEFSTRQSAKNDDDDDSFEASTIDILSPAGTGRGVGVTEIHAHKNDFYTSTTAAEGHQGPAELTELKYYATTPTKPIAEEEGIDNDDDEATDDVFEKKEDGQSETEVKLEKHIDDDDDEDITTISSAELWKPGETDAEGAEEEQEVYRGVKQPRQQQFLEMTNRLMDTEFVDGNGRVRPQEQHQYSQKSKDGVFEASIPRRSTPLRSERPSASRTSSPWPTTKSPSLASKSSSEEDEVDEDDGGSWMVSRRQSYHPWVGSGSASSRLISWRAQSLPLLLLRFLPTALLFAAASFAPLKLLRFLP